MKSIRKVVGTHQVNNKVTTHYAYDFRPALAYLLWAAMMTIALLIAVSCDDSNSMYQGPDDDTPQYGAPR